MSNDNRVPGGVPTGGEFAPGEHGENEDLPTPESERAARIESILAAPDIEDKTQGLIEQTGIEVESGEPTQTELDDNLKIINWSSTFTNPHNGQTMTRDLAWVMDRKATTPASPDLTESMVGITSEAWAVDRSGSAEEYAKESGFAYQTPEDRLDAEKHWDEAVARRDELRDFLGEDYDAFVYGRSQR